MVLLVEGLNGSFLVSRPYPIDLFTSRMSQILVGRVEERNPTNDPILKRVRRLFFLGWMTFYFIVSVTSPQVSMDSPK